MRSVLTLFRGALRLTSYAMLAMLVLMPFAQIVMRGVFNVPMAWAEELTRYFLICLTFLGAALVTADGGQIRMEEFQALVPEKPRWLLQLVIEAAGIVLFGFIAFTAFVTISKNMTNQTATLEMPFWLFMAPLALGAVFLALETALMLRTTWLRGRPDDKQTTLS
jgi:TRAP-type C4-dicarboxylate transport system permease small subunit